MVNFKFSILYAILWRCRRGKLSSNWSLDPSCVFSKYGSFGATPIFVQEEQNRWRKVVENEPVKFYEDLAPELMLESRKAIAKKTGCDAGDLALIENATTGVNTIIRSLEFNQGDEIIVQIMPTRHVEMLLIMLQRGGVLLLKRVKFHFRLKIRISLLMLLCLKLLIKQY